MKAKEAFDKLFEGVKFDSSLYKKILHTNIEFITRNEEFTRLFSGRNIGCYLLKYTMYDKNIYYDSVFGLEADDVIDTIKDISTIPKSFKVARDDINLAIFYIVHRFLSNKDLSEKQRLEFAKETLNYFSYRTLVLISSNYFIYPISEEKATSLTERLSNKYLIKKLKNWNEYCQYRSDEFLDNKFRKLLDKFDNDDELSKGISDLYIRTKDTIKNIYSEFMIMLEKDEVIKSKSSTITDTEGDVNLIDKIDTVDVYMTRLEHLLVDKSSLVKREYINTVIDIVNSISYTNLEEVLDYIVNYTFDSKNNYKRVHELFKEVVINAIDYLQRNNVFTNKKLDIVMAMNYLVGNVLYARGDELDVHRVKINIEKLIKDLYKLNKNKITDRNIKNLRNGVYLYVVLRAFIA